MTPPVAAVTDNRPPAVLAVGGLFLALLASPVPVLAQSLTLDGLLPVLKRVEAPGTPDPADVDLLNRELGAAGAAYRAMIDAGPAPGQPRHSCPPPKGQVTLTSRELIPLIETLPEEARRIPVQDGLFRLMAIRYPC